MKAVFFDLDGTLLPMDLDLYLKYYFDSLADFLCSNGDEKKHLYDTVMQAIYAAVANDGSKTNRQIFIDAFAEEGLPYDEERYDEYYRSDFEKARAACGVNQKASRLIKYLKERGMRIVLATNPLYPAAATEARIRWAGLEKEDFEYITTYENSSYSKPNPMYYTDLAAKLGLDAPDVLMVGNDTRDDITAASVGMRLFFLTDCIINKNGTDLAAFPHGDFDALKRYIDTLL